MEVNAITGNRCFSQGHFSSASQVEFYTMYLPDTCFHFGVIYRNCIRGIQGIKTQYFSTKLLATKYTFYIDEAGRKIQYNCCMITGLIIFQSFPYGLQWRNPENVHVGCCGEFCKLFARLNWWKRTCHRCEAMQALKEYVTYFRSSHMFFLCLKKIVTICQHIQLSATVRSTF